MIISCNNYTDPCSNEKCDTRRSDRCDQESGQCKCGVHSFCSEPKPFCANPGTEHATCISEVLVTMHADESLSCSCTPEIKEPCTSDDNGCQVSVFLLENK